MLLLKHKDRAYAPTGYPVAIVCLVLSCLVLSVAMAGEVVRVVNPFKVYLAGTWAGKEGPEMNQLLFLAGAPEPWHSYVTRAILSF